MPRYIDADALLKLPHDVVEDSPWTGCKYGYSDETIKEQPTVSTDEVRGVGEWILKQDNWWGDYAECSICHDEYTVPEGGLNFKFCPNCGSKMKGY